MPQLLFTTLKTTYIKNEKTDSKQNINYENISNSSNVNYVNEEIVTLFSDEIEFSDCQYSELDLKKKSLNNLKELANLCKIKVPSKINKGELINLILNFLKQPGVVFGGVVGLFGYFFVFYFTNPTRPRNMLCMFFSLISRISSQEKFRYFTYYPKTEA